MYAISSSLNISRVHVSSDGLVASKGDVSNRRKYNNIFIRSYRFLVLKCYFYVQ